MITLRSSPGRSPGWARSTRSWCTGGSGWTRSRRTGSPTCGRCATRRCRRGSSIRRATGLRSPTLRPSGAESRRRTPPASSACSPTAARAATSRGAPRCCSTRARRCTWPESRPPMRTGWRGRAARSRPVGRTPPWSGCVAPRRLELPDDPDHDALHHDVAFVDAQRIDGGVRGLESDPAPRLAGEPLHRGAGAGHERDDGLAVVGLVTLVYDDEVAVFDVLVDHRLPADLEHVAAAPAGDELIGHGDDVVPARRLERDAGGHQAQQRELGRARLTLGRHHFDGPALVMRAPDEAFALEVREMLVYCGQRLKAELPGDLFEARRIAFGLDVARDEVENLALTGGERHTVPRRKAERLMSPKIARMQACPNPASTLSSPPPASASRA